MTEPIRPSPALLATLAGSHGSRRLELILDAPEPKALVRALPAQDLFLTICELGLEDAEDLVRLATPLQFRAFVDLDVFAGVDPESGAPKIELRRLLDWLGAARGDGYREKLRKLDGELVQLLLRDIVQIWDLEEDGEPAEDPAGAIVQTPEGRFLLVYPEEGVEYAVARRIIDDLYAEDAFMAGRILYAVRCELQSDLEEGALRWRNARMGDLGFPTREEALSLFAKLRHDAPPAQHGDLPRRAPGFFLASTARTGGLFERAAALLPADELEPMEAQLAAVLNMALVADGVPVAEPEAVRETARLVRATLSLGLEAAVSDDPAAAMALLVERPLKRLFQEGWARPLQLQHEAKRLLSETPAKLPGAELPLADAPDAEALNALLGKRPRMHPSLKGDDGRTPQPFGTLAEVQRASEALGRARRIAELLRALKLVPAEAAAAITAAEGPSGLSRVRATDLVLTACAREAAGAGFAFTALPTALLPAAQAAIFDGAGRILPRFQAGLLDALLGAAAALGPSHEAEARALAARSLAKLAEALGPVVATGAAIDPRHAAPLIVSP